MLSIIKVGVLVLAAENRTSPFSKKTQGLDEAPRERDT